MLPCRRHTLSRDCDAPLSSIRLPSLIHVTTLKHTCAAPVILQSVPIPCNCICPCLTPSLVLLGLNQSATGELKIYSTHASLPPPQARSAHSSANLMIVYSTCFSYSCHRRHTSSALGGSTHVFHPAVPSPSPSRNPASLRSVGRKNVPSSQEILSSACVARPATP